MGRDGTSVVERVAAVLEQFVAKRTTSLTFNELLEDAGMPKATLHRVLGELTRHRILAQDSRRDRYRLGPLVMSLAGLSTRGTVIARARTPMEALRDQFGETIVLAELSGGDVMPVFRVDGLHEMRMTQEIGRRYPAYAGGTGKLLLAVQDPEQLTRYLSGTELVALTDATITDADALRADLERIRSVGVAVSVGERVPSAVAISAPVFDATGEAVAAITLSGMASRFDADLLFDGAIAVSEAVERVSDALGYRVSEDAERPTSGVLSDPTSAAHDELRAMCARAMSVAAGGSSGKGQRPSGPGRKDST